MDTFCAFRITTLTVVWKVGLGGWELSWENRTLRRSAAEGIG